MKNPRNADRLWRILSERWPKDRVWLTIGEIQDLVPLATEGITNRSSYDFAMLTLSRSRRSYLEHSNELVEGVISDEVVKTNRNNGVWRRYLDSQVKRAL